MTLVGAIAWCVWQLADWFTARLEHEHRQAVGLTLVVLALILCP